MINRDRRSNCGRIDKKLISKTYRTKLEEDNANNGSKTDNGQVPHCCLVQFSIKSEPQMKL